MDYIEEQEADTIQWSEETKQFIRDEFKAVAGSDNDLDSENLEEFLHRVGFDPDRYQLKWLIDYFDTNKDRKVQVEEILERLPVLHAHSVDFQSLSEAFHTFDKNQDGYIRLPELKKILTKDTSMTAEEAGQKLDEYIKVFDRNKDGKFDYSEFMEMYISQRCQCMRELVEQAEKQTKTN